MVIYSNSDNNGNSDGGSNRNSADDNSSNNKSNRLSVLDFGAAPDSKQPQTAFFQAALDEAFRLGGGRVEVPAGRYLMGSIRLRSNTTLHLQAGAQLYGLRDPESYEIPEADTLEPLPEEWRTEKDWEPFIKGKIRSYDFMKPGGRWNHAMIRAIGAENVTIVGEEGAVIDGQDCYDARGEENYRGPHGISMQYCRNLTFRGYTIRNTGNWAHCITACENIRVEHITVLGGHDGVHCTSCVGIRIQDSEFYTGDDCIAGFGNINTLVSDCVCNTACSGLRFGGTNALIRNCRFFGPARYFFRGSLSTEEKKSGAQARRPHRTNMLSVFTYYADFSVEIPQQPGNIVITDCTVDNVDRFLHYNFSGNERWQAHRPLADLTFRNIRAQGVGMPLTAYGSPEVPLQLTLCNVSVAFREDVRDTAFLHAAHFDRILLEKVSVRKKGDAPLIRSWTRGGDIVLREVDYDAPASDWVRYTDEPFVCRAI